MKNIFSSIAFQNDQGAALQNGSLILTLPPGVYLIVSGGGQVYGGSIILNLDATGKLASIAIWVSDELSPQTAFNVTLCAQPNGLQAVGYATWFIGGTSPIDLSLMTPSATGPSYSGAVVIAPTAQQTINGQPLVMENAAFGFSPNGSTSGDAWLSRISANVIGIGTFAGGTDGFLRLDNGNTQSSPVLSVRRGNAKANALEFGHSTSTGYGSNVGCETTSGLPFIAFMAEGGTNTNTYRTRGNTASIIRANTAGLIQIGSVASANADNQTFVSAVTVNAVSGAVTASSLSASGAVTGASFSATAPGAVGLSTVSGAAGSNTQITLGRTATDATLAIAGAAGQFFTNSDLAAGDFAVRQESSGRKIYIGAGNTIAPIAVTNTGVNFYGSTSGSTSLTASATASGALTLPATTGTLAIGNPKQQIFTGNGTFTIPAGVTAVKSTVVGGGGAGCGSTTGTVGGGGGGGGTAIKWLSGLTPGNTITVTVGSGGTGVSNAAGNNGGNSSISSGTQTITTVTGGGGTGSPNGKTAGSGGTCANGDLNIVGCDGTFGIAGTCGGTGGSSTLGGGGRGSFSFTGAPGGNFGGGGGGAEGNTFAGGNGAAGLVIFEWVN